MFLKKLLIIAIVLSTIFTYGACSSNNILDEDTAPNDYKLSVLFINVGKADSILISFDGYNYLIDTGTNDSLPSLIKTLKSLDVNKLDGVFLTHTHSDHIGGLNGLLELIDVKKVYLAQITDFKKDGSNSVIDLANKYNIQLARLARGDEILLSENNDDARFAVVGPYEENSDYENDNSLVMYLDYFNTSFLFAGDMQFAEEESLERANLLRSCTVLKVGNHGNNDATSLDFALKVDPEIAVFTTDKQILASGKATKAVDNLRKTDASLYTTGNTYMGLYMQVSEDSVEVSKPKFAEFEISYDVNIEDIDNLSELVVLRNLGESEIDMTGWWMLSEKGNEVFFFPDDTKIKPNEDLLISSGDNNQFTDLYWNDKNVWRDKKEDKAKLYDSNGFVIDTFDTPSN